MVSAPLFIYCGNCDAGKFSHAKGILHDAVWFVSFAILPKTLLVSIDASAAVGGLRAMVNGGKMRSESNGMHASTPCVQFRALRYVTAVLTMSCLTT